jgi:hypothetical protein
MLIDPCARGFLSSKFTTTQCTSSTWFMWKDSICFSLNKYLSFLGCLDYEKALHATCLQVNGVGPK